MATDAAAVPVFPEGSTVVRRDTLRGKVFSAIPYRVIRDTGTELVAALWPGVEMLTPSTWIECRQGPFADGWSAWRPDPSWSLPALPWAQPAGTGGEGFTDPDLLDPPGSG